MTINTRHRIASLLLMASSLIGIGYASAQEKPAEKTRISPQRLKDGQAAVDRALARGDDKIPGNYQECAGIGLVGRLAAQRDGTQYFYDLKTKEIISMCAFCNPEHDPIICTSKCVPERWVCWK